jgi:predicted metalloprotease with PDZ domain
MCGYREWFILKGMATRSAISIFSAPVHYSVDASDVHAHLYRVTLTIARPTKNQRVSLPVWIPGSYMVREFSKHLQKLVGAQDGTTVPLTQLDKCTWQAINTASKPLVLQYEVYAYDNSVRTAWLDTQRGFFNPTSLCLQVLGLTDAAHHLHIKATNSIAACAVFTGATALKIDKKGFGMYSFSDYDALADTPFELGNCWHASFVVRGVTHQFVVAGAPPSFDGKRLLADTQKIVETEMAFWHGAPSQRSTKPSPTKTLPNKPPFSNYVFMLNAVDDGYGGLEHRNSTALICTRRDLPRIGQKNPTDGYTTLLGLISHEYFHTWNVKRLRPAEFARYDYRQEQTTQLLWFFEGFTSYYDDLLLRRAGLIDNTQYLKLLNKTINQVMQTPGGQVQSVAQSSFDAWVKYYRQDENTANATVSYYTKGALVALCFDLTLRGEGKTTLDDVMRALWVRCKAGPAHAGLMTEADFAAVLRDLGGRSFATELAQWVHGTGALPLERLLTAQGVQVIEDKPQLAQRLGLRVAEANGAVQVKVVLRGGAAEQAGFCAGDEWLAVGASAARGGLWRLNKLDDLTLYVDQAQSEKSKTIQVLVSRDKRLHTLKLTLPAQEREDLATWVLRAAAEQSVAKRSAQPSEHSDVTSGAAPLNAWLAG